MKALAQALCSTCLLDHCYYPKSCLLPQMGTAYFIYSWSLVRRRGKYCHKTKDPVCPAGDEWSELFLRIICHSSLWNNFCKDEDFSSSLWYISCPGVTVKDSDYHNGNPLSEEQHNHFLHLCKTNNPDQRIHLCYIVISFGFHLHCICDWMISNKFGY